MVRGGAVHCPAGRRGVPPADAPSGPVPGTAGRAVPRWPGTAQQVRVVAEFGVRRRRPPHLQHPAVASAPASKQRRTRGSSPASSSRVSARDVPAACVRSGSRWGRPAVGHDPVTAAYLGSSCWRSSPIGTCATVKRVGGVDALLRVKRPRAWPCPGNAPACGTPRTARVALGHVHRARVHHHRRVPPVERPALQHVDLAAATGSSAGVPDTVIVSPRSSAAAASAKPVPAAAAARTVGARRHAGARAGRRTRRRCQMCTGRSRSGR